MKEKLSNLTKKVLPFFVISILASSAYGIEKNDYKLKSYINGNAYHFMRRDLNENNKIKGLGISINNWEVSYRNLINSQRYPSNWLSLEYTYPIFEEVGVGINISSIDGYPQNNFKWSPLIAATLDLRSKKLVKELNEFIGAKIIENLVLKIFIPPTPKDRRVIAYTWIFEQKF